MLDYISGMYNTILLFLLALILVDFLIFIRAWSFGEMKIKRIFIFLLKLDAGFIISAILLTVLVNVPHIVAFFQ
jgi:hypothetical protein